MAAYSLLEIAEVHDPAGKRPCSNSMGFCDEPELCGILESQWPSAASLRYFLSMFNNGASLLLNEMGLQ